MPTGYLLLEAGPVAGITDAPAALAAGVGTAYNAVGAGVATQAPAGVASGTSSAFNAASTGTGAPIFAPAGVASGTGTALGAFTKLAQSAVLASGTGAANVSKPGLARTAGVATGTGNASPVTSKIVRAGGFASGTGSAPNAVATRRKFAPATLASGTGAASAPKPKLARTPTVAAGTGTAHPATATISNGAALLLDDPVYGLLNTGVLDGTGGGGAFPDATNTGTLGASLTTVSVTGTLWRTSTDGAALYTTESIGGHTYHTFTNKAFVATTAYVYIDDPYVRFDHCSFTASGLINNGMAVVQQSSASLDIHFDDCSIDGGAAFHNRGISGDYGSFTIRRCNFTRNGEAAVEKNDRNGTFSMDVQDSYVHEVKGWVAGAHTDGLQMDGGLNFTAVHNTIWIEPYNGTDGDTSTVSNSCVGVWSTLADIAGDILIDNNQLAGGGTVIYCEQQSFSMLGSATIRNNVFVRNHFASLQGAQYNPTTGHAAVWYVLYPGGRPADLSGAGAGWTGNTWEDGSTVTLAVAITST